jgi:hypothetical protein
MMSILRQWYGVRRRRNTTHEERCIRKHEKIDILY